MKNQIVDDACVVGTYTIRDDKARAHGSRAQLQRSGLCGGVVGYEDRVVSGYDSARDGDCTAGERGSSTETTEQLAVVVCRGDDEVVGSGGHIVF